MRAFRHVHQHEIPIYVGDGTHIGAGNVTIGIGQGLAIFSIVNISPDVKLANGPPGRFNQHDLTGIDDAVIDAAAGEQDLKRPAQGKVVVMAIHFDPLDQVITIDKMQVIFGLQLLQGVVQRQVVEVKR